MKSATHYTAVKLNQLMFVKYLYATKSTFIEKSTRELIILSSDKVWIACNKKSAEPK